LDRWSGGRLILGVGSGGDAGDFVPFGESFDPGRRAAMLGETVTVVDRLLRGETVDHRGPTVTIRSVAVGPSAIQHPRPPIWIGGMKPGALRLAAAWDGWIAVAVSDTTFTMERSPDDIRSMIARCRESRVAVGRQDAPFDVAVFGISEPGQEAAVAGYADAGATWWFESLSPMRGSVDALLALVESGPPDRSARSEPDLGSVEAPDAATMVGAGSQERAS
jgi:alkanesulfonate monooxygenase SsuD/methylene tetrahydromethanopterin reductase-like flavin-dependent oxidoreductase (luciferase family)